MAAHDSSEHAERAEQRDIGDATLEQLRADLARLSREYMTGEPLPMFLEMRRVRDRVHTALDRRLWPRDQAELYLILGCLNCLMAVAADGLGYPASADEFLRAGWAYATVIDHRPLMAQLRLQLAQIAYWSGRRREARDLAANGLYYLSAGPNAANLHLQVARAAASLGDADAARQAISAADDARQQDYQDELLEIEGEFSLSQATHHYFAGSALSQIEGAERDAAAELEQAAHMYAAGPQAGEQHGWDCKAIAHIDLATVRLREGDLEAASAAAQPALLVPPNQRIGSISLRFGAVRVELARPRYQGSRRASQLDQEIEAFGSDTIVGTLAALPG
jgi:hypothetical protein